MQIKTFGRVLCLKCINILHVSIEYNFLIWSCLKKGMLFLFGGGGDQEVTRAYILKTVDRYNNNFHVDLA